MNARDLADFLRRLADLRELSGANEFRIRALMGASLAAQRLTVSLDEALEKGLGEFFNKSVVGVIEEWVQTGTATELTLAQEKLPEGLEELLEIPGLGVKKVRLLWQTGGITDMTTLRQALAEDTLKDIPGMGAGMTKKFQAHIDEREATRGHLRLDQAQQLYEQIEDWMLSTPLATQLTPVGTLARGANTLDKIEILVETMQPGPLWEALTGRPDLTADLAGCGLKRWMGRWHTTQTPIEIHLSGPESFVRQQVILTGPKSWLLRRAHDGQGTLLSRIRKAEARVTSEYDLVVAAAGEYIEPELRDHPEWSPPDEARMIEEGDLRGMVHLHTRYSDGKATLEEMARRAHYLGYEYMVVTDHSRTAAYAGGLSIETLEAQGKEVDALNRRLDDEGVAMRIFKGIESDILADGSLDYPDDVLATLDVVIASVHSNLGMSREQATERLLAAVAQPYTTMLGHPSGRLLLSRPGYELDYETLFASCRTHGVAIEINANPYRLDLDYRLARQAAEAGVGLMICPDAHSPEGMAVNRYGVQMARKAGLQAGAFVNTRPIEGFKAWLRELKKGKGLNH